MQFTSNSNSTSGPSKCCTKNSNQHSATDDRATVTSSDQPVLSSPVTSLSFLEHLEPADADAIYAGSVAPIEHYNQPDTSHPSEPRRVAISPAPYWSPALQNLLDQPPSNLPIRLIAGGLLFCVAFGAWACLGRVQEVSHAQGQLIPKGEVYKVQPTVQGEITQLRIKEGQHVKAGQVLAVLDNQLAETEVTRLQQSLVGYRLQLMQLQGQINTTHLEISSRRTIADAEIRAQEAKIAQTQATIATNQTLLSQMQSEKDAYQGRLNRLQPLVEEGVIAREQLFETEQALREHDRLATQKQGELQQATTEVEQLQAELLQHQAEGKRSELEAQQRIQQLQQQTAELQAKITETEMLLQAAETKLEQMYLYSPVNGVISTLNIKNIGEVTQPGATIAEMIPDGTPLIISAKLPNREAGGVEPGMTVKLKFDAFPYQDYGVLSGHVISISPNTTTDEKLGAVYQIEIAVDQEEITVPGKTPELKAGQTARAEIVTRDRRIIDVLLDPLKKLQQEGINL